MRPTAAVRAAVTLTMTDTIERVIHPRTTVLTTRKVFGIHFPSGNVQGLRIFALPSMRATSKQACATFPLLR